MSRCCRKSSRHHHLQNHLNETGNREPDMRTAIAILANTPPWVFALLALLIWQGCMALRPSSQPLARMLIIPAVFFLMGLSRLVLDGKSIGLLSVWMVSAAVFAA